MEFEEDYSDAYQDDYSESNGYYEIETLKREDSMQQSNQDILFQRTNAYYIMDSNRTEKYIDELVNDLRDTWGVSESTAYRLLKKFAWDKEKAISNLTEDGNLDTLEIESSQQPTEFDCPICYTTEPLKNGYSFGCDHYYCKDCFAEYVTMAINEGQPFKTCATEGCKEILTPRLCFNYFRNNQVLYTKYKRFLLQTIVDTSFNLLWCPGTGCLNIIQLLKMKKSDKNLLNIRCPCGYCFCFACRDVAHRPLQCDHFAKWMAQVGGKDDSLNTGWIQKNSKACPQCKVHIEKNQGCMHMTCRNCKYEFCWICMGNWKEHNSGSFYNCNNFKQSENQLSKEQIEYEKFNFYRDRFEQHWNSLKHAIKKKKTISDNFKSINHQVQSMKDDMFLTEALDLIIEARRAITMTYAAGYYRRFTELQKDVYEMQQSLLWTALDNLDKFTDPLQEETKMENLFVDVIQSTKYLAGKFNDYKVQLTNKTGGVVAACNKLLKSMEQESEMEKTAVLMKQKSSRINDFDYLPEDFEETFESEYWLCAFCTFGNPRENQSCEMCNNPKRVLEGDPF